MENPILQPVIVLVVWSFVIWAWLYATRIPAILRLKVPMDPRRTQAEFAEAFPPEVRWKADNYNHLMEQPTLFYATILALIVTSCDNPVVLFAAWAYVALRIVHSLIQSLSNRIRYRFLVFMLASIALIIMIGFAVCAAFLGVFQ